MSFTLHITRSNYVRYIRNGCCLCVTKGKKTTILITLHRSNSIDEMCQKPLNFIHETSVHAALRLFFAENQNKCQLQSTEKNNSNNQKVKTTTENENKTLKHRKINARRIHLCWVARVPVYW